VQRYLTKADGTIVGAEATARAEALRSAALGNSAAGLSPEQREKMAERMREYGRQNAYRIAEAAV
jgi:hypothetical protein